MNTDEGLHSGATVLCWMGRGGALLVFALMLIVLALDGARTSMWHWLAGLIVASVWFAACYVLAWIIDGFAHQAVTRSSAQK
jgi:hypothetical protein